MWRRLQPANPAGDAARGCPCHLAGRSLQASCLPLARRKPRFRHPGFARFPTPAPWHGQPLAGADCSLQPLAEGKGITRKKFFWLPVGAGCRKSCGDGVCGDWSDIDSVRKMAVEFGVWQGWQARRLVLKGFRTVSGTGILLWLSPLASSGRDSSKWSATTDVSADWETGGWGVCDWQQEALGVRG